MYNFINIKLEDKSTINKIRKQFGHTLAFHNFASMYMWRDKLKLTICIKGEFFVVKEADRSNHLYYFPCGNEKEKKDFITYAIDLHHGAVDFCYLCDLDKVFLEEHFPGKFLITHERDNFEYIYSVEEQVSLEGSKYKNIRKEINRIKRNMCLSYEKIAGANMNEVRNITTEWNRMHLVQTEGYYGDVGPCFLAYDVFKQLDLFGILVREGAKARAFVIGSELSYDTVNVHIAKCDIKESGLDYYSKKIFYESISNKYHYINREDDMGMKGLREKKLSQHPIELTQVWKGEGIGKT